MKLNFYQSLGLLPDDSYEKIRLSRRNIINFATDSNGVIDLNRYRVLKEAYNVIENPNTREQYDNHLKRMKKANDLSQLTFTVSLTSFLCSFYNLLNNQSSSITWISFGVSILSILTSSFMINYSSNHVNGSFSDLSNQITNKTKVYTK